MGAGANIRPSAASMRTGIDKLRERELNLQEEYEKDKSVEELKTFGEICKLRSECHQLAEELRTTQYSLRVQSDGWKREQNKTLALMFSDLPLSMLNRSASSDVISGDATLTRSFPMVSVAQCDVVGFSSLSARLQPQQLIHVVDHLHAIIDEAFSHKDIFIMEQTTDGCIAASGLVENTSDERSHGVISPLSMTDSSYGSEFDFELGLKPTEDNFFKTNEYITHHTTRKASTNQSIVQDMNPPSYYTALLAQAALKLMSLSSKIEVPLIENKQLQLRIAIHSGPCSAGVLGLQSSTSSTRIPHYKLFGPTVRYVGNLCTSGLALQIRMSKMSYDLLSSKDDGYTFERCPDYMMCAGRKPIESYWLVGKNDIPLKLPSLELALPLTEYEDIET